MCTLLFIHSRLAEANTSHVPEFPLSLHFTSLHFPLSRVHASSSPPSPRCADDDGSSFVAHHSQQISKAAVLGDANEVLKAIHKLKRRAYLCAASAPAVAGGARA